MTHPLYDTEVRTINGEARTLRDLEGKVALIVNTASRCGFTPQYAGLEQLHRTYGDRGLAVLGFPCNQFGRQEPGDDDQVAAFCEKNYGVTFTMHSKIDVNGARAHPLFDHLKAEAPGVLGSQKIKWNFTKFLVDRSGKVVARYAPTTKPEEIAEDIQRLLDAG